MPLQLRGQSRREPRPPLLPPVPPPPAHGCQPACCTHVATAADVHDTLTHRCSQTLLPTTAARRCCSPLPLPSFYPNRRRSNALLLTKVATLFSQPQLYGRAIGCFYPVFEALEEGLRQAMSKDKRELLCCLCCLLVFPK